MKARILFSIPSQSHVEIALDEKYGLEDLGHICGEFGYAARDGYDSLFGRLYIILSNAVNLVRLSIAFRPDVIYLNSRLEVKAGVRDFITLLLVKCFYLRKVQFIIKSHGSDIEVLTNRKFLIRDIVLPFLKKNVDAWLFLSAEEKREIDKINFLDPEKVFVTKNIVRINQFHQNPDFKSRWGIPDDHQTLLFTGRIIREKGIFEVLEAFGRFKDLHKTFLIVVGSGSDFIEIQLLSNSLGLSEKILFTGFIPEKNVVEFYSNCDLLVFPTYFPEGFPMSLFNSVAAGLGILTTPTRAAVDFLSEPENCLWVIPKNTNSVLEALMRYFNSHDMRTSMQQNNKRLGVLFGKQQVCLELESIILNIR